MLNSFFIFSSVSFDICRKDWTMFIEPLSCCSLCCFAKTHASCLRLLACAFMFPMWKAWLSVKNELLLSAREENSRQAVQNISSLVSSNWSHANAEPPAEPPTNSNLQDGGYGSDKVVSRSLHSMQTSLQGLSAQNGCKVRFDCKDGEDKLFDTENNLMQDNT